ncbi:MAG TPA: SDR family NAD(P)-dependent oxidoreductase [Ktedonobacterales bacterium]|jgi:NAD(P)-dependent dehydrogenase (short-subunit alcohol dehydrogenase family)
MDFSSKVAVLTGAGGGWGRAVALAFLNAGASVVVVERPEVCAERAGWKAELGKPGEQLTLLPGNVFDEASVEGIVKDVLARHGHLDVLVNMVGGFAAGQPVHEMNPETWERMLQLNLRSAFLCSKHAAHPMIQQRWGRIITISSRAGVQPGPKAAAYAASKAAVISLTESQAEELKDDFITVNTVLPSIVDTPANRQAMPKADFSRWPKGEEIAPVILFLASEEAKLINGAAIPVYGRA